LPSPNREPVRQGTAPDPPGFARGTLRCGGTCIAEACLQKNRPFITLFMYNPRMKRKALIAALALASSLALPASTLYADDADIPYAACIPYRIVRGAANIALGWTEIILRPFGESKTESIGEAMSMGGAHTLMRLVAGVTDITTFWVPDIQMLEIYPDWQGWPYLFHWS